MILRLLSAYVVLIAHRTTYVQAFSGTATEATAMAQTSQADDRRLYSEEWFATSTVPSGYKPPTVAAWHSAMDNQPQTTDPSQAGYMPDLDVVPSGDRRLGLQIRYYVVTDYHPWTIDSASSKADAGAQAQALCNAVWYGQRPMDYNEWCVYGGGHSEAPVDLSWYQPKVFPFAGFFGLPSITVSEWRSSPVPSVAPRDMAIRLSP